MAEASHFIRILAAVGLSAVAHVVLVGAALALSVNTGWGAESQPDPIAIELLTTTERRDPPDERVVAPEHPSLPQPRADEVPARDHRNTPPSSREITSSEQLEVEAPSIMAPEVRVEEPANREPSTEEQQRRMQVLLNPANVARAGWRVDGQGPTMPGPPAGLGRDRPRSEREIEAELGGGLRAEAMTKRHITRTEPQFRRRSDGSLQHEGHRFVAVIDPCGHLTFQDRPGISTNGFSASGTFDLGDLAMQGAGQDPYAAERNWVDEHTRDMRDEMEGRCRTREAEQGLARLRGRLVREWATAGRTPEARRRRIFGIWDEMEPGDAGREARDIVLRFIRDTIPQGSEDAFTPQEIARFNASRESREEFRPY